MNKSKRIELENGSAMVCENYTPEIKKALNEMCKILIEAVKTKQFTTLIPNFNDGKFEKGEISAFKDSEKIIEYAKDSL